MMASPAAAQMAPDLAKHMNRLPKVVFSRTLSAASWENTKLVKGDLVAEVRKMKEGTGSDLVVMGSGSIVAQLAQADLVDELKLVLNPVVLGSGKGLFAGVARRLDFTRVSSRSFENGNVYVTYARKA